MGILIGKLVGFGLSEKIARLVAMGGLFLVLLILVASVMRIQSCTQRHREATKARLEQGQQSAAIESGKDAINATATVGRNEAASEALTRENEGNIRAADGAGDAVKPGVRDAGIAALCRRAAYRDDPRCQPAK